MNSESVILVLGVGNTLLSDDGAGVHVVEALRERAAPDGQPRIAYLDGGTIGLSLLPDIEDAAAVIIVDAAELGASPGTVRCFVGPEMDAQLKGKKRTAHEVAVADLMAAAELGGRLPDKRALVAIQPASTEWGLAPTAAVTQALPQASAAVLALVERWRHEL